MPAYVVVAFAFHDVKVCARCARNRVVPAVTDPRVQVARVERLKVTVQRVEIPLVLVFFRHIGMLKLREPKPHTPARGTTSPGVEIACSAN